MNFTLPDTSCVGAQINITNLTTGGTTFFWDFCSGNANITPVGVNIGNPGNMLTYPLYITLVQDSNDFFSFASNQALPRQVTRYYLGNSFRNDPVSWTNLIPAGLIHRDCEAIQVKKDNGNWYGFINDSNTILRFDFGPSLWNNNPAVTDLGITALISVAHGLIIRKEGSTWMGFLDADLQNKLYRLNFGSNLANSPALEDLGNVGGLNHPCQFAIQQENGTWYMLIANFGDSTISRINFGNSLFNTPTGANLGHLGGIPIPDGITYLEDCDTSTGYFSAWTSPGSLGKLIFAGGIGGSVTAQNIGDIGTLYYPSTFSEIFRQNDTLFTYVPNWNPSSMTRLSFPPCNNATIPSSDQYTPPPFSYNQPGIYRVRLQVDAGLPDQVILCKHIVIVPAPIVDLGPDRIICPGQTITLDAGPGFLSYLWSTGATTRTITVSVAGTYSVTVTKGGCTASDSVNVSYYQISPGITGNSSPCLDTDSYFYQTEAGMLNYQWSISAGGSIISGLGTNRIEVKWNSWGSKFVRIDYTTPAGCTASNPTTFPVMVYPLPGQAGNITGPLQLCAGYPDQTYFVDTILFAQTYTWEIPPGFKIINGQGTDTIYTSIDTSARSGDIYVYGHNQCGNGPLSPPFLITILQSPVVEAGPDQSIPYDSITVLNGSITGGSGNYSYSWKPSSLLTSDSTLNPGTVKMTHDTLFILTATDLSDGCQGVDSVRIKVVHHEITEECLVFHNVITPNGDGLNDKWIIDCIENFPNNKVTIFNRWGDIVNSFKNYDNVSQVWEGTTTDGKPLPDGTYYYVLTIRNGGRYCGWILLRGN